MTLQIGPTMLGSDDTSNSHLLSTDFQICRPWRTMMYCLLYIQYNTIQIVFASSTHKNIHLLHINNICYTIIDDAGGIWSQLDRLPMPPVFYSKHGAGQGTVMRGGGDNAWVPTHCTYIEAIVHYLTRYTINCLYFLAHMLWYDFPLLYVGWYDMSCYLLSIWVMDVLWIVWIVHFISQSSGWFIIEMSDMITQISMYSYISSVFMDSQSCPWDDTGRRHIALDMCTCARWTSRSNTYIKQNKHQIGNNCIPDIKCIGIKLLVFTARIA